MVLKLEQHTAQKDIEVLVTYPARNKTVERIVTLLKTVNAQIECFFEDDVKFINVSDIYYIESAEKTAVVFSEKQSYKTKFRLYQLNEKLKGKGFIQISKYCILNIGKLERIKPLFNSRMEAILSNGSRLDVTRKYLSGIKQILQENE